MSEKRREPLMGDDLLGGYAAYGRGGAGFVRDHYERLIDEGKLIVAKECELVFATDDLGPPAWVFGCNRRGPVGPDLNWCPFCGGKIKR